MPGAGDSTVAELGMRLAQLTGINAESRKRADLTAYATKVLDELQARAPEGARSYFRNAVAAAEVGKPKPFLPWGAFTGGPPPAVALLWRPVEDGGEGFELFGAWDLPMFLTALGPGGFLVSLAVADDAKEHAEKVFTRAVNVGAAAGDMLADAASVAADAAKQGLGLIKWAAIGAAAYGAYRLVTTKKKG